MAGFICVVGWREKWSVCLSIKICMLACFSLVRHFFLARFPFLLAATGYAVFDGVGDHSKEVVVGENERHIDSDDRPGLKDRDPR